MGMNKSRTTPFHPRSDCLTVHANRTILQMLWIMCKGDSTS